jgi:hypothetical protein
MWRVLGDDERKHLISLAFKPQAFDGQDYADARAGFGREGPAKNSRNAVDGPLRDDPGH